MKLKFFIWCFSLTCFFGYSQSHRFVYLGTYKPDKTEDRKVTQLFALDFSNGKSVFYSIENPDSRAKYAKELAAYTTIIGWDLNWYIFKDNSKVDFLIYKLSESFEYEEREKVQWVIRENFIDLGANAKAQLAETEFGGRSWKAYFNREIPIFDGPYKFRGLPGLIAKIQSVDGDYSFEMIAIEDLDVDLEQKPVNTIKLAKDKYLKVMQEKIKNPIADVKLYYINKGYSEGVTVVVDGVSMTLGQMFKQDEIVMRLWLEQHNNPIENSDIWFRTDRIW